MSFCDKSGIASTRFLDGLMSYLRRSSRKTPISHQKYLNLLFAWMAQNLGETLNKKSLLKFLLLFAFAKSRNPLNFTNHNQPSEVDSQNLRGNLLIFLDSANPSPFYLPNSHISFAKGLHLPPRSPYAPKAAAFRF